jgi:GrpB-like predicted nucleotidyltransferase (UPF0157 family)
MKAVTVVPPDAQWPMLFEQIRAHLWPAIASVVLRVEHVGSTAVPGLAAKPVIDIDLVIADENALLILEERLRPLGYTARGTLGVPGRWAFRPPNDLPTHHLYACPHDSEGLQNHLTFRDYLRANPLKAREYGALKLQLAQQFPQDMDRYIAGKTAFIVGVLEACAVPRERLASIAAANRPVR